MKVPLRFWHGGRLSYITEITTEAVKLLLHWGNPFLLSCLVKSDIIYMGQKKLFYPYNLFKKKIRFLPQAASTLAPNPCPQEASPRFNVLFVGRFVNLKGVMIALESFERYFDALDDEQKRNVAFTLIGSGPLDKHVAEYARRFNSRNGSIIHIVPWIEQSKLVAYYRQATIFLYPSFEGQGLVVAEAMAHGLPVICLENTGPHDVAGEAALTVPVASKEDTINNISLTLSRLSMEYWKNPELYKKLADQSYSRAEELDWKNKAAIIVQHYHDRSKDSF